ncbi:hypothetical protein GZ212_01795 [Mangrovimonas sp. CR14]|uniref:hypothetical protein n=1 Tax=Mangrovimonas sp. CR14 TaxID=2706120 RepID=UPI00142099E4|nr:hypothetical protein [Mangrovimonas sp. CR14]NIK90870.1 hypothetical protein [Mangrovimonas sp. CR14]
MKIRILIFLFLSLVLSCKDSNEVEKGTTESIKDGKQNVSKNQLILNFNAVIEKNGTFTLFFLEEGQKDINIKNSSSVEVKGSKDVQTLIFNIKEDVIPDKLFLRFVNEEKDQTIEIKETILVFGDKEIVIKPDSFFQYFMPNKFVDYDEKNFIATTKEIQGNYLPRFSSREALIYKMLLEF